jgi:hypothetical protein
MPVRHSYLVEVIRRARVVALAAALVSMPADIVVHRIASAG